jgi:hypothetical protein
LWQLTGYGGAARSGGRDNGRGGGGHNEGDDDGGTDRPSPNGGWDPGGSGIDGAQGPGSATIYDWQSVPDPDGMTYPSPADVTSPADTLLADEVIDYLTPDPGLPSWLAVGDGITVEGFERTYASAKADPKFRAFIGRHNALAHPDSFDNELNVMGGLVGPRRSAARGAGAGGRMVVLYRAVKPAELADIQATGRFRSLPGGVEGKYFTTSADAAASYGRQAVRAFGDPPYTIVKTQVPESVLARPGISATVDRGIPAYVLPDDVLPGLRPEILNHSPVPR